MSTAAAVNETPPAGGRRERRKLEVRRRMLEAAEALFEERGVQQATVAEICERADVAHKTFFNHFPAKQDLVRALADESLEILLAEIDAARAAGRTTGERLRVFFESVARRAAGAGPMHSELFSVFFFVFFFSFWFFFFWFFLFWFWVFFFCLFLGKS